MILITGCHSRSTANSHQTTSLLYLELARREKSEGRSVIVSLNALQHHEEKSRKSEEDKATKKMKVRIGKKEC